MIQLVISLIAILILTLFAFKYPPITFAIFLLTSGYGDGYGINGFLLSKGYGPYEYLISIPLIISVFVTFIILWKKYLKKSISRRLFFLALLAIFSMIWAGLVSINNSRDIITILRDISGIKIYAIIFVLAYWNDIKAHKLFIFCLIFQLSIAACLMLFPYSSISVLSARNYLPLEYYAPLAQPESFTGNLARISPNTVRAAAQFYNENAYGYYSVFGVLFGILIPFRKKSIKSVLIGSLLFLTGVIGWTVTVSRGATLGIILALSLFYFRYLIAIKTKKQLKSIFISTFVIFGLIILILSLINLPWEGISKVFQSGFTDNSSVYRMTAEQNAPEVITRYPLFGIPQAEKVYGYFSPHETISYYSAEFGIPIGLIVLYLIATSLFGSTFIPNKLLIEKSISGWYARLAFILAWFNFITGFSNATAAGCMSWLLIGISCIPWVFNYPKSFNIVEIIKIKGGGN